jgi:ribosomal protein S18 acetylase RimI-like enzyme
MDEGRIGNMRIDLKSASDYLLADLVEILNRGFENYLVPIQFNVPQFMYMLRKDSIDLTSSRVLVIDDEPSGIGLIARRGWTSRLAAMGISEHRRGNGAGSWFVDHLIQESRQRGDHEMVLEVIEQNIPAVRLYQKHGFQTVRRLIGFILKGASENSKAELHEMDLREAGLLISLHGLGDLPWQLSGETIAQMNPPARAYRREQVYAVISNPDAQDVVIWSVLVEPDSSKSDLGINMLKILIAKHPEKTWHVPVILPEELGAIYERAGFDKESLSQWQMRLNL